MKVIGRRVHAIVPNEQNARNGGGDFIRLPDGRIMFAYSDHYTGNNHDHSPARISAIFSSDEGESFGDYRVVIPSDERVVNRMFGFFLPMQNGEIGLFYGEKFMNAGGRICLHTMLTRTKDGEHFSEPIDCTPDAKYAVINNARAIRLSSGRILIPTNDHPHDEDGQPRLRGSFELYYSDDDGKSFKKSCRIDNPLKNDPAGLQETGVIEIEGGRVLAYSRTYAGSQFICVSEDGGESFSTPEPSPFFTSPCSPMHMRHLTDGRTVAVWNPLPPTPLKDYSFMSCGERSPLALAVVNGKGGEFLGPFFFSAKAKVFLLEDDPKEVYCYPAVFEGEDYLLCSYFHSYGTGFPLSATVIKKVLRSELEEQ
jgi:hypothetical protein